MCACVCANESRGLTCRSVEKKEKKKKSREAQWKQSGRAQLHFLCVSREVWTKSQDSGSPGACAAVHLSRQVQLTCPACSPLPARIYLRIYEKKKCVHDSCLNLNSRIFTSPLINNHEERSVQLSGSEEPVPVRHQHQNDRHGWVHWPQGLCRPLMYDRYM